MAKEVGEECNKILVALHKDLLASLDLSPLRGKISELSALGNAIQTGESPESLGDLVENELAQMDKAIEEAALKMEVQSEYIFIFLYHFPLKNPLISQTFGRYNASLTIKSAKKTLDFTAY